MPLANSLQSLIPARTGLPGAEQPPRAGPAPLCGPEGVREGTRLQAGPSQVRSLRSRPQARGRRGPLATRGDCPLTPQDCRVSAPGTPGDPCSPHTHTPTTTTTFYKLFQLTGARGRGRAKARKFSAPSPKLSVLGKQLKESDKGGTRGRTPPRPPLRRRLPRRPQERRHRAGSGSLPQTDRDPGEPPPATSSSPDQSPPAPRPAPGGGAPALGEGEVWEGPGEVTQYLSLRAAGSGAGHRRGGEGTRWARVLAGSGGPWASAPPSAAASCRRSPGCARRSAGYLWPSRLARRPLGRPPRPPARPRALGGWGRSAPQRPARGEAGPPSAPAGLVLKPAPCLTAEPSAPADRPPCQEGEQPGHATG